MAPTIDEPSAVLRRPEGTESTYVVLVGASAGGLEALSAMFKAAPKGTGMAFVVVQHLSPDHQSMMAELLTRQTQLQVVSATDRVRPAADTVYVMQPQTGLHMEAGALRIHPASRDRPALPINALFESAAEDLGPRCAGVILSGTGSDGANGLVTIKDHGGTVVVQDPTTARFDGMPQAALRTGVADMVLPPDQIVKELGSMLRNGPAQYFGLGSDHGAVILARILAALRQHTEVDFGHYKPSTIVRRVQRRMDQLGLDDPRVYAEQLKAESNEAQHLYRDLLIGVTRFLRDPGAIEAIEQIAIPRLLALPDRGPLRIWVPACSTGEEAYSIAMLLAHALEQAGEIRDFRIFATDIDSNALDYASKGEFPETIREVLPDHLLSRYFARQRDTYIVRSELRDRLLFSRHNLVEDPPFSRLDMVSCRNLLIYLKQPVQDRVLRVMSLSLVDEGILWLGSSETVGHLEELFATLDARWRVYATRPGRRRQPVIPSGRSSTATSTTTATRAARGETVTDERVRGLRAVERALLSFAPPTLIVDANMGLIYRFGDTSSLLELPEGPVSLDVRSMLPANIGGVIISGIARTRDREGDVVFRSLSIETRDGAATVDLRIRPIPSEQGQPESFALIFEGLDQSPAPVDEEVDGSQLPADLRGRLDSTERELRETRENLQATIEELESANEELQSMNEELVASNEELQSTNEELQSVNEELHTVNMEHEQKVEQLMNLTEDLDNILGSVDSGVLVLDDELRLRRFNEAATRYFSLLSQDVGRPLAHLNHTLTYRRLIDDAAEVVRSVRPADLHCETSDRKEVRVRIRPHRHTSDRVGGLVVTITDTTNGHESPKSGLMAALQSEGASLVTCSADGAILHASDGFARAAGRDEKWLPGQSIRDLVDPVDRARVEEGFSAVARGEAWVGALRTSKPDGHPSWELVEFIPLGASPHYLLRLGVQLHQTAGRLRTVDGAEDGREFFAWWWDSGELDGSRGLSPYFGREPEASTTGWKPVNPEAFSNELDRGASYIRGEYTLATRLGDVRVFLHAQVHRQTGRGPVIAGEACVLDSPASE